MKSFNLKDKYYHHIFGTFIFLCVLFQFNYFCFGESKNNELPPNYVLVSLYNYYPNYDLIRLKHLEKDLQKYFNENYPKNNPGWIKGDFNGDKLMDYAFLLRKKNINKVYEKLVVLIGNKEKKFESFILMDDYEAYEGFENSYIRVIPSGTKLIADPSGYGRFQEKNDAKKLTLKNPGIEYNWFEKAAVTFYWEKEKFVKIQTSD